MSKFDTEDRGALGYFLTEDGQSRLRNLHQHIVFLSRLAEPRVDEEEDGPEIDHPALAGCMDLLAEQVQLVLDTVAWPARLQAKGKPLKVGPQADDDEAEDADEADGDAAPVAASADDNYDFGMTMDQLDELHRLLDLLRAQGDLMMATGEGNVAKETIIVTGSAIFDGAEAVDAIIDQVETQILDDDDPRAKPRRVREMPPAYGVHAVAATEPKAQHRAELH
ncbi:hypothetical protein LU699_16580 [Luteimonas fraxinea]|uniref:XAC0095-like domain-containing protein n=1 Tax=Luteimonas fraxinea TaxID=2901869 RepID=A0ABS8UBA9_9GAMM|nr:hypothetical protein [Luteimonas fraxinea]MCD9096801.1 hypothetical protein [Luteimonas fraxinea]UHH09850.1 hypothetical protein LU699_16580 [Luteimonas fraxinea]